MSRFEMDDQFWGHHKTKRALRAGAEAIQMWMAMRFYVAINNSGGLVPDEDINDLDGAPNDARKWLGVLVGCGKPLPGGGRGAGLVDQADGFWMLHDYDDHGLSPEEVERRKELSRERQRRWRQGRLPESKPQEQPAQRSIPCITEEQEPETSRNAVGNASRDALGDAATNGGSNAVTDALCDVPDPIRSEERSDRRVVAKDLTGIQGDRTDRTAATTGPVRCPPDLRLTDDQRGALETSMVPGWAIDALTAQYVSAQLADETKTMPLVAWRKCLAKAVSSAWNDPRRRPKKPAAETTGDAPAPGTSDPPSPGQVWHRDGYWYYPLPEQVA